MEINFHTANGPYDENTRGINFTSQVESQSAAQKDKLSHRYLETIKTSSNTEF